MAITRKVISRMQWWTPPASPAKGLHSTALSRSLGQTYAEVGRAQPAKPGYRGFFPCYCALMEAVAWSWSVVIQLDGDLCQSVTLVSLLVIDRDGITGKQCRLDQSKYRNTQMHKYTYTKIQKM